MGTGRDEPLPLWVIALIVLGIIFTVFGLAAIYGMTWHSD